MLSTFCARTDLFDREEVMALFDLRVANTKEPKNWLLRGRRLEQRMRQITALIMLAWWWQHYLQ